MIVNAKKRRRSQVTPCIGYLSDFTDMLSLSPQLLNGKPMLYIPNFEGLTMEQTIQMYVKYLQAHPDELDRAAVVPLLGTIYRGRETI